MGYVTFQYRHQREHSAYPLLPRADPAGAKRLGLGEGLGDDNALVLTIY